MALDPECLILSVANMFFTLYHYAECRYAECRYAECRYAECHGVLSLISSKDCLWLSPPTVVSYLEKCPKAKQNGQFKKNAHSQTQCSVFFTKMWKTQTQWSVFFKCAGAKHGNQFLENV